jgi:uncharacterized membrane protein YdjX (TVP38/TMEM64 family)
MRQLSKSNILKIVLLILVAVASVIFIYYAPQILKILSSMDNFREYIRSTGSWGPIMFILFQVLQIVVSPIPGEIVQIAGGYIYGVGLGTLYNMIGMVLGSAMAFYFTRFIGRSFIEKLLQKKNYKWMALINDEKKFSVFLFIFFIIPGLPKDFLVYVAALTSISSARFFIILLVARLPWIIGSVAVGSTIHLEQYTAAIIISIISVVAFILGYFYKDKLVHIFSKTENETGK